MSSNALERLSRCCPNVHFEFQDAQISFMKLELCSLKNRKAPAELFQCNCPCKKVTNHSIILSLPSDLKHPCSEEQASNLLLMTVFLSIPFPSTNLSPKITFTNRQSFYSEHSFHVLYHFLKCLSQTKENKKKP